MSFAGYRDSVRQTDADALGMAECALPLFDFSGRLGCNRRLRSAGRTSRPSLVEAVKRSTMQHRTHRGTKLVSLTAAIIGAGAIAVASPAPSAPAGSPAPPTALAGTSVLDPNVVLAGLPEPGWFKDNIPLLDVPESRIQQVYYYRWGAYKRHLRSRPAGCGSQDRKSTRLNSSHMSISYAVFCLKKKKKTELRRKHPQPEH